MGVKGAALATILSQTISAIWVIRFLTSNKTILKIKKNLNEILAKNTGKPYEEVEKDTDRDNYLSAEEALEYGLIDKIFVSR